MTGKNSQQKAEFIEYLRSVVLEHIDQEDFNVQTFAAKVGISRSELYRRIKRQTGKSVTEFIRDIRLEEGMKLLQDTDLTAAQISFKTGFNSPTYFNKCFKDKFGITPGEADAGKTPVHHVIRKQKAETSGFWKAGRSLILIIAALLSGFGLWYYFTSGSNPVSPGENPAPLKQEAATEEPISSLAVLPLRNWTGDEQYEYICFGITDAIISELTRTKSFERITPINDVFSIKDSLKSLNSLYKTLDVRNILQGNVQKAGSQIKVSLHFMDVMTNKTLWSDEYIIEWTPDETFILQQKIADEVLKAVGKSTNGADTDLGPEFTGTTSDRAYDLVMKGRYQAGKFTGEGWHNALELYEEAIKEDPQYVFAYHSLGYAWLWSGAIWSFTAQDIAWKNAKHYFMKILELDPENEGALRGLKIGYFMYDLNIDPKPDQFPQITNYRLENTYFDYALKTGLYSHSENHLKNIISKNPSAALPHALLALTYFLSGKELEAKGLLDETYRLFDDDAQFLREAAKTYLFLGEDDKMTTAIKTFYKKFPDRPPVVQWLRALAYDYDNEIESRDQILDSLKSSCEQKKSGSPAWFLALYYCHKGNYDLALDWLERSYEAREVEMTWLAQEPLLAPLGPDPRYRALLEDMSFPHSARRHVIFKQ